MKNYNKNKKYGGYNPFKTYYEPKYGYSLFGY